MPNVEIDDKELAALRKSAAQAEALTGKVAELSATTKRLAEMEAELGAYKAQQEEAAYTAAGITDAKVRKLFTLEFEEQAATADGVKDRAAWLAKLAEMPDAAPAILAPFLAPKGTAGQGGMTTTTTLPKQPSARGPLAGGGGRFEAPEQIAAAMKDPAQWAAFQAAHPEWKDFSPLTLSKSGSAQA